MREAIYFDRQIEPWMHHPTLPCRVQIQIVAEGIGWSWIVKLLIWASRVTLVLKDIKQSSSQCAPGPRIVPDCQGLEEGSTRDAAHTSKAADTWHVTEVWTLTPAVTMGAPSQHCQGSPDHYWPSQARASVTRQCVQSGQTSPVPLPLLLCCCATAGPGVVVLLSWPGLCCWMPRMNQSEVDTAARTSWVPLWLNLGPGGGKDGLVCAGDAGTCLSQEWPSSADLASFPPALGASQSSFAAARPEVKIRSQPWQQGRRGQPLQIWRGELRNSNNNMRKISFKVLRINHGL